MARKDPPTEVTAIRGAITDFLKTATPEGRTVGSAKCGVYAFYDYDGEPIYVGQTVEGLAVRLGRHLTGRRSDAVAKFVLDPFEVADIEVWPMFDVEDWAKADKKEQVDRAEYTVYQRVVNESEFGAVLNEGDIPEWEEAIDLPPSYRGRIIPDALFAERAHPDVRLARRAQTIASLARLISERVASKGLRRTLLVQSQRLEWLSRRRFQDFSDLPDRDDPQKPDEG